MAEGGAPPSSGQPVSGSHSVVQGNPSLNKTKVQRGSRLCRLLQETLIIVSIDGGGVRGLIPTLILGNLERAVRDKMKENFEEFEEGPEPDPNWKLLDCVDFLVGTSTGGIIALAWGQFQLPIKTVEEIYNDNKFLNLVFDPGWKDLRAYFRLLISYKAMYHINELKTKMTSLVPPGKELLELRDDIPMIFVTTKNNTTKPRTDWLFRNYQQLQTKVKPGNKINDEVEVVDAALATSAAPLVFKEYKITVDKSYDIPFSDGGVFANHPGKVAWDEVNEFVTYFKDQIKMAPGEKHKEKLEFPKEIILISIGTGKNPPDVGVDDTSVTVLAIQEFVAQLTDTKSVHEELEREERKTGSLLKYLRINPDLENISAFKSDEKCITYMKTQTEDYLKQCVAYESAIESLVTVANARRCGSSEQAPQDPATM